MFADYSLAIYDVGLKLRRHGVFFVVYFAFSSNVSWGEIKDARRLLDWIHDDIVYLYRQVVFTTLFPGPAGIVSNDVHLNYPSVGQPTYPTLFHERTCRNSKL